MTGSSFISTLSVADKRPSLLRSHSTLAREELKGLVDDKTKLGQINKLLSELIHCHKVENTKVKIINRKQTHQLLNSNKLYRINGTYKGFKIGETVTFNGEFRGTGQIRGFGVNSVLVIDKNGSRYIVNYNEITQSKNS